MVAIGPRPGGLAGARPTRALHQKQLEAAGLKPRSSRSTRRRRSARSTWSTCARRSRARRRTAAGIVIGGHYDTKLFREFPFVGASDGGSSAAFLLELARALKGRTQSAADRAAVPRRRGSGRRLDAARITPTAAATTSPRPKKAGTVKDIRAFILVDMIGDRDLGIRREQNSTPWLTDAIWSAAKTPASGREFLDETTPIEDDHLEFLEAGIRRSTSIDLDYPAWHRAEDTPRPRRRRQPSGRRATSSRGAAASPAQLEAASDAEVRERSAGASISAPDLALASARSADASPCAKIRSTSASLGRHAAPLQPEHHVRLARHRADVDLLLAPDQAGRHAGIHRVDELAVLLPERLDDGRGVDAGGGAEGVAADDRIVRRESARRSQRTRSRSTRTSADRSRSM